MNHTAARQRTFILVAVASLSLVSPVQAEEQTARYGLIGLFTPDRKDDLRELMRELPEFQLASIDTDSAEVTIRYDLAKLFPNFNAKKPPTADEVFQRLNNLLGSASQGTFRIKPLSTVPKDKLTRVEIKIGVLDCKACRYGAYSVVLRIDGVERATVSAQPSMVTAWIDPSKTDRAALEAALKRAGVQIDPKP